MCNLFEAFVELAFFVPQKTQIAYLFSYKTSRATAKMQAIARLFVVFLKMFCELLFLILFCELFLKNYFESYF